MSAGFKGFNRNFRQNYAILSGDERYRYLLGRIGSVDTDKLALFYYA